MQRFHIPNHGGEEESIVKAFVLGLQLCGKLHTKELTLVVPSISHFSSIVVGQALGETASKQLMARKAVKFRDGVSLRIESVTTLRKRSEPEVVLAFYIDTKDLKVVDSLCSTKAIIYVPWSAADGVVWQRTWNAEVPGQKTEDVPPKLDPAVKKALKTLTYSVNLSTGLGHPSDLRDAKRMFSDPGMKGLAFDPAEIRVWAVRNGWQPQHADKLENLAQSYLH